jgi:hypothetical protein
MALHSTIIGGIGIISTLDTIPMELVARSPVFSATWSFPLIAMLNAHAHQSHTSISFLLISHARKLLPGKSSVPSLSSAFVQVTVRSGFPYLRPSHSQRFILRAIMAPLRNQHSFATNHNFEGINRLHHARERQNIPVL